MIQDPTGGSLSTLNPGALIGQIRIQSGSSSGGCAAWSRCNEGRGQGCNVGRGQGGSGTLGQGGNEGFHQGLGQSSGWRVSW